MNGKIRKYLPLLGIVAVLVLWGLWYSRPAGVGTLFPDFDPDSVEVIVTDYAVGDRTASYSKGTPEYDAVLSEVRGFQFRRSALNPLRQVLPYRGPRMHSCDADKTILLEFTQEDGKENQTIYQLEFFVRWVYRVDSGKILPLEMTDSEVIGTEMAYRYWDQIPSDD